MICHDCGASKADATFPRKVRGQPARCVDCARTPVICAAPVDSTPRAPAHIVTTRASYRARYRNRAKSDQLDMVDLLVPPP